MSDRKFDGHYVDKSGTKIFHSDKRRYVPIKTYERNRVKVAKIAQERRQMAGFVRLLASYGCVQSGEDQADCGECGPCEASAWLSERGLSDAPRLGELSDREIDLLGDLIRQRGWSRPMDIGGYDGSDHSAVLARLVIKGYAEMKAHGGVMGNARSGHRYRALFSADGKSLVKTAEGK